MKNIVIRQYLWVFSTWNLQNYTRFSLYNTEWGLKLSRKFCSQLLNCKQNKWKSHPVRKSFYRSIQHTERGIKVEVNPLMQSSHTVTIYWNVCVLNLSAELPLLEYYFINYYTLKTQFRKWNTFWGFYSISRPMTNKKWQGSSC